MGPLRPRWTKITSRLRRKTPMTQSPNEINSIGRRKPAARCQEEAGPPRGAGEPVARRLSGLLFLTDALSFEVCVLSSTVVATAIQPGAWSPKKNRLSKLGTLSRRGTATD